MAAFTPLEKSVGTVRGRTLSSLSSDKRAFESFPMSLSLLKISFTLSSSSTPQPALYIPVHEYLGCMVLLCDSQVNLLVQGIRHLLV